ncbi:MAG: hypothetical protein ACYTGX_12670 [Planctomycetota bacterium]
MSQRLERDAQRPNPISRGDAYIELLNSGAAKTRAEVAETFGISTAAVSYHIALVERLPREFVSWLRGVHDGALLRGLTERKLRAIARRGDTAGQRNALRALIDFAGAAARTSAGVGPGAKPESGTARVPPL